MAARIRDLLAQTSWWQRILLLLAIAAPVFLAGMFSLHQRAEVIASTQERAQRSVVALEQHAASVLDAHSLILRQLLRITLSRFSEGVPQVGTVGVTDGKGNMITNSLGAKADRLSVDHRDYFVAHEKDPLVGMFVSEAFTGQASLQRLFALSIRRTLPNGEFGGVVFTTVPLKHFTTFWKGFTPQGGHLIPMVRPDGVVIARYPRADSPPRLDPHGPFISHLTSSRIGLYTAVSLVDGIERINAYSQIKDYPLYISFSVETQAVLKTWRNEVLGVSAIAALMASLLVALWVVAVRQSQAQRLSADRWEALARALQEQTWRRQEAEESMRDGAKRLTFGEQLIGIVSHDLRNPLHTISVCAEVISLRDALGPQDAQSLQRIRNASQRAVRLIRDLLDFTQARLVGSIPVHALPMDFHELLQSVLAEVDAGHPDRVECLLHADKPQGEWDPDRLAQVVENLVLNALKYGAQDGIVRVRTSSDETWFMLEVNNDGALIPADKMAVIFEPLQRDTDASQPNLDRSIGMGLFIVKHIVDAHGGSISVDSVVGRGTTFTVRLPKKSSNNG